MPDYTRVVECSIISIGSNITENIRKVINEWWSTPALTACTNENRQNESGQVCEDIAIRVGRFLIQTPLGTWADLGSQSHYNAPGILLVEIVKIDLFKNKTYI